MQEPISIAVWSDIACPWCYIGKRRLEAGLSALAERPDAPAADVVYRSFQLAPDTPVDYEGSEVDFLMHRKGMAEADVRAMMRHVAGQAAEEGLAYDFDRVRHTNTAKAHELLHHARREGRQAEVKERLMAAYFVEGRHLGHDAALADIAAEAGLDRDDALAALADGRHRPDVEADIAAAGQIGIAGVPFFVFDGRHGLSGAQRAETFVAALDRVVAARGEGSGRPVA